MKNVFHAIKYRPVGVSTGEKLSRLFEARAQVACTLGCRDKGSLNRGGN